MVWPTLGSRTAKEQNTNPNPKDVDVDGVYERRPRPLCF